MAGQRPEERCLVRASSDLFLTAFARGKPNARIADFHSWLVGTDDKPGFLSDLDLPHSKKDFSEETLRLFTHRLGFSHEETGYGCFSDDHESPENKADRNERFGPQYNTLKAQSVHTFSHTNGAILDIDDRLTDRDGTDLIAARVAMHKVTDADGLTMDIDIGGILPTEGPVHFFASHDESCFAAGDFESSVPHPDLACFSLPLLLLQAWQHNDAPKKQCKSKSTGPKLHYASFVVEYGNGTICLRPDQPRKVPLTLKQLRTWHALWSAGYNVPLPPTADVSMRPGKNHEMWWCSEEFWMQCDLAIAIFRHVFFNEPRFKLVACLDWSQGHAAMAADGLDAENMLVNPGGKSASHLRHTFTEEQPRTRLVGNRRVPVFRQAREALCSSCHALNVAQKAVCNCQVAHDKHGHMATFQSIGTKGLKQVLTERKVNIKKPSGKDMVQAELVEELQKFPDFEKRNLITRAYVTELFKAAGQIALFGVKFHCDLAPIERMWMFIKAQVRKNLDGNGG